jgi:hypothetical protein
MLLLGGRFGVSWDGSAVAAKKSSLLLLVFLVIQLLSCCQAYFVGTTPIQNRQQGPISKCPKLEEHGTTFPPSSSRRLFFPRNNAQLALSSSSSSSSVDGGALESEIASLCEAGKFDEAITSLEELSPDTDTTAGLKLKSFYVQILKGLVDRQQQLQEERIAELQKNTATTVVTKATTTNIDDYTVNLHQADKIVQTLLDLGKKNSDSLLPSAEDFHNVIKMWGSSTLVDGASVQCQSYLETLWSLYDETEDEQFVPWHESYYYAVLACSARDRGLESAKRAEHLLNEMESKCHDHPKLTPNRSIANGVM